MHKKWLQVSFFTIRAVETTIGAANSYIESKYAIFFAILCCYEEVSDVM